MRYTSSIGARGAGISAVLPKLGPAPRRAPAQRAEEDDVDDEPRERAPPPPGMGKLVDRLV